MANNIAVEVTVGVADLVAKRAILSSELRAATADLTGFAKTARTSGMTDELRADMLKAAEAAAKARAQIALLDVEMRKLGADSEKGSVLAGIGEGLASVKGAAESVTAAREAVTGFGEALAAAFAIEGIAEWAKKMGESGERTEHLAQILGTTTGTVVQLQAAFTLMGVGVDSGVMAVERLDRAFARARQGGKEQEAAFKALGVSTAENYTQMQLLAAVMDGFAKQADGPAKAAESMTLLGRSGAALIPFLDLGSKGLARINEETEKYRVTATDVTAQTAQLGEAFNENAVAAGGIQKVLASAFAPTLTLIVRGINELAAAFIQSYNKGGLAKTILDALVVTFKAFVSVVAVVGAVIVETFETARASVANLAASWDIAVAVITGKSRELGDAFVALGHLLYDALTSNIWDAARDMKAAEDQMASDAAETARKVQGAMARAKAAAAPALGDMGKIFQGTAAFVSSLWGGKPAEAPLKPTGEGEEGDTSGDARGAGKKPKKAKDDQVEQWREQLEAQEVASGEYFKDQTAAELAFWQSKLALTQKGSKDWLEVQKAIYDASKTLAHQDYQAHLADLNDRLEADKNSWAKEQADWQEKLAYIAGKYGEESAEYKDAHRQAEAAERQHQQTMADIARDANAEALSELKSNLDAAKAIRDADARQAESAIKSNAKYAGPLGDVNADKQVAALHQQMLAQQMSDDAAYHAAQDKLLQDDVTLARERNGELSAEYQKAVDAKSLADLQFSNQQATLGDQMVNQARADAQATQQAWVTAMAPIGQAFDSAFQNMITRQETFRQVMLKSVDQILFKMIGNDIESLEHWTATELSKTAATVAGSQAQVAAKTAAAGQTVAITHATGMQELYSEAVVAAGGAYKAMAGIPIIGPELGAAAAVATFAAVMGLGSFDRGLDMVPNDMVAQIHAGERIVPAADNAAMIDAMRNGGGSGGGDSHVHYSPTYNGVIPDRAAQQESQADFTKRVQKMRRRGIIK